MQKVEIVKFKKEISVFNTNTNSSIFNANIDATHHSTATFNILYFEAADTQICFDDFTASLKTKILEIAGSFNNLNTSEWMLLAKLSIEI